MTEERTAANGPVESETTAAAKKPKKKSTGTRRSKRSRPPVDDGVAEQLVKATRGPRRSKAKPRARKAKADGPKASPSAGTAKATRKTAATAVERPEVAEVGFTHSLEAFDVLQLPGDGGVEPTAPAAETAVELQATATAVETAVETDDEIEELDELAAETESIMSRLLAAVEEVRAAEMATEEFVEESMPEAANVTDDVEVIEDDALSLEVTTFDRPASAAPDDFLGLGSMVHEDQDATAEAEAKNDAEPDRAVLAPMAPAAAVVDRDGVGGEVALASWASAMAEPVTGATLPAGDQGELAFLRIVAPFLIGLGFGLLIGLVA
ncbi:MAG: hypothetical protein KDE27_08455 [Planctomycetes bacterium]|nr:hypothetical protein [Planctomycetota bacterium]